MLSISVPYSGRWQVNVQALFLGTSTGYEQSAALRIFDGSVLSGISYDNFTLPTEGSNYRTHHVSGEYTAPGPATLHIQARVSVIPSASIFNRFLLFDKLEINIIREQIVIYWRMRYIATGSNEVFPLLDKTFTQTADHLILIVLAISEIFTLDEYNALPEQDCYDTDNQGVQVLVP